MSAEASWPALEVQSVTATLPKDNKAALLECGRLAYYTSRNSVPNERPFNVAPTAKRLVGDGAWRVARAIVVGMNDYVIPRTEQDVSAAVARMKEVSLPRDVVVAIGSASLSGAQLDNAAMEIFQRTNAWMHDRNIPYTF